MDELARINWVGVIIATVVGFGIGAIWFNPKVFGTAWMTDMGKTGDNMSGWGRAMTIGFVATLLAAIGLAWLIRLTGAKSLVGGTKVGLLVALAFVVTNYVADAAYAGTKNRFVAIVAGYRAVMLVVMGAILGRWH